MCLISNFVSIITVFTFKEFFMDNKWSINETKQLFDLVYSAAQEGNGLNGAFTQMANSSGK